MNNFQNNTSLNLYLPQSKTPTEFDQTRSGHFDTDKKKRKENKGREKLENRKPTGTLKILFESENLNRKDVEPAWEISQTGKKKNIVGSLKKEDAVERGRKPREEKKKKKLERGKSKYKKPNWVSFLESEKCQNQEVGPQKFRNPEIWNFKQVLRAHSSKARPAETSSAFEAFAGQGKWKSQGPTLQANLLLPADADESSEKHPKKAQKSVEKFSEKSSKVSFGSQVVRRDSKSEKAQPTEVSPQSPTGTVSLCLWSHKSTHGMGKAIQINPAPEAKPWDSRKTQINEILKGHAQKIQGNSTKSCQNIKDYALQGVTELLLDSSANTSCGADKKEKKLNEEDDASEQEEEENKSLKSETSKKSEEEEDGSAETEEVEERKKKLSKWMTCPQSNELERRLNGAWFEQGSALPPSKAETEEKSSKGKDEKKEEKRLTYTDRLLLSKMSKKDGEKSGSSEKTSESSKTVNGDSEIDKEDPEGSKQAAAKKNENWMLPRPSAHTSAAMALSLANQIKEINSTENREIMTLKDARFNDVDPVFKARSARSNELRDLVTHAVREHKIFCIFDNHWYIVRPVREELLNRGWLEVIPDRRLIPKRRPPPSGPAYDREKNGIDHTIEAILSAKETFVAEIQETVSKSSSLKMTMEKPKSHPFGSSYLPKKFSEESLTEVQSQFRIIPPTSEKKKNNMEIREFVEKYQNVLEKEKEKELEKQERDKDRAMRTLKREKAKMSEQYGEKIRKKTEMEKDTNPEQACFLAPFSQSLQTIIKTVCENKKTILEATIDIEALQGLPKPSASLLAIESGENPTNKDGRPTTSLKALFTDSEAKVVSKIIQSTNARIHFMWLSIKPAIHLKCFNYSPEIVNKFQRTTFCTKIGLWSHLNNIQWYAHEVHFPAKSPRMYNTGEADDLQAFFQDFQLTACIGMLKWLSDTFFERGMKAVHTKKGKVPLKAFEFAIKQCEKYMRFKGNEDLGMLEEPKIHQDEWNTFLQWFYTITNDHGKIQESSSAQLMVVYTKAVETLRTMKRHWPEIDIDGRLNIWIMKPYCASCGRGIFMTNNIHYISQHSKYIVQKYIEKPLLIYNTKFDIRQWFMITKLTPLEIWMYKECYLRFCTQPFALRNLHESVHLSNNSVQRKYVSNRDPSLPDQNMWDSNTFQLYLKTIGYPNTWQEIIYPGMKDAIVSTMLAAQDTFDGPRKNWFEIYGADFMLSANLKDGPWLIEINENPAMDPSTKVTARLCPQMLRDVIKVVVDKRSNKFASTGQWELVYRQNYSPSFGSVDLDVKGKKIARVPHNIKIGLGHSQSINQPASPPVSGKRPSYDQEAEPNKLYEVVKGFNNGQNNRGDANQVVTSFAEKFEARGKLIRTTNGKNSQRQPSKAKTPEPRAAQKLGKERGRSTSEDKQKSKVTTAKREGREGTTSEQDRPKNSDNVLEVKKINDSSDEPKEKTSWKKPSQSEKSAVAEVSSTGRFQDKRSRNYSSSRETSKKQSSSNGGTRDGYQEKNNFTDYRYVERENKTAQNQSNYQTEKYKFTKFYKL